MATTPIDIHLNRIKEIREEQKEKIKQLSKSVKDIIEILSPKLSTLPNISSLRSNHNRKSLKENIWDVIYYFLYEENPNDLGGFIELGTSRDTKKPIPKAETIVKKLNPVLIKVGLVSTVNNNGHMNAINIKKISTK